MNESRPHVLVSLTGGLGNQLFQLSAGLALANGESLGVVSHLAKPRMASDGQAELFSFILPESVIKLERKEANWLFKKVTGYLLRMGVQPRSFEKLPVAEKAITSVANVILSFEFSRRIRATFSKGVGYWEGLSGQRGSLAIGYFQSYQWASRTDIREKLDGLHIKNESSKFGELKDLAEREQPLVVHVRLGDYLLESDFGIPSKEYYANAISNQMSTGAYKAIWAFSDDEMKAREYLPAEFSHLIRWNPEVDRSSVGTLQAMRLGKGYVIGNSSFSWWGAFLSFNKDAEVIAPSPWFKGMESPRELIPPSWKQMQAW